jgi:hypothetical protein
MIGPAEGEFEDGDFRASSMEHSGSGKKPLGCEPIRLTSEPVQMICSNFEGNFWQGREPDPIFKGGDGVFLVFCDGGGAGVADCAVSWFSGMLGSCGRERLQAGIDLTGGVIGLHFQGTGPSSNVTFCPELTIRANE